MEYRCLEGRSRTRGEGLLYGNFGSEAILFPTLRSPYCLMKEERASPYFPSTCERTVLIPGSLSTGAPPWFGSRNASTRSPDVLFIHRRNRCSRNKCRR